METVLGLRFLVGLLVALTGLAVVGGVGMWSMARCRPVPAPADEGRDRMVARAEATAIAIRLERAQDVGGLGRHDERRCAF
jgi:hypothetical protein